ncbi:MAG: metallophosphoesterase family protein [Micromonosporaceae bacterium]
MSAPPSLYAVSDLHVAYPENRRRVGAMCAESGEDWLIVAGDVGEVFADVVETLAGLRRRYAAVIWTPGNHELWTHPRDPVTSRGEERYHQLVAACRERGVLTPEDPYPVWRGEGGPVTVAPLFVLYDYSFLAPGARDEAESLRLAYDAGIVCTDEMVLHPDPYLSRAEWCRVRLAETERRLGATDPRLPTVLVNHYPLVREPTMALRHPEFAQWCGTVATADWHRRYRAAVAVYGHLHIPRTTEYDGVRFEEVSLGYPREWSARATPPAVPRAVFTRT